MHTIIEHPGEKQLSSETREKGETLESYAAQMCQSPLAESRG